MRLALTCAAFLVGLSLASGSASAATISGTVSVPGGFGFSASGLCVTFTDASDQDAGSVTTGAGGAYSITSLAAGTYSLSVDAGPGCSDQNLLPGSRSQMTVAADGTLTGQDVSLTKGASIAGTVSVPGGFTAAGICVTASGAAGDGYAVTGAGGSYTIQRLEPGTYTVVTDAGADCSSQNLVSASLPDISIVATQDLVSQNLSLVAGATISGTVAVPGGFSAAGICMSASAEAGEWYAVTGSGGTYSIPRLPAGTYTVTASAVAGCSNQNLVRGSLVELTVTTGQALTGQNLTLVEGATISGTVSVPGGFSAAGICVSADGDAGESSTTTGAGGVFTISRLPAGTFAVSTDAGPDCSAQNLAPASRSPITVTAAQALTGQDFTLVIGATISGTVSVPNGFSAVDICLTVYDAADGYLFDAQTTVGGAYSIIRLAPGTYRVRASAGVSCSDQNLLPVSMSGKTVVAGQTLGGQNFALVAGATISGTVSVPNGFSPVGLCVSATGEAGDGYAVTGAGGAYTIERLPAGTYELTTDAGVDCTAQNLAPGTRSGVTVGVAQAIGGQDLSLVEGATISGTVTVPNGFLAGEICVSARGDAGYASTVTGSGGAYTLARLVPGTYTVTADAGEYCSDQNLLPESLSGRTVASGATLAAQNITLVEGASISGTVSVPNGFRADGICVSAIGDSGYGSTVTGAGGTYTIERLVTDTYTVSTFADEGCSDQDLARGRRTDVAVTVSQALTGQNISLVQGATISGTVTVPAGFSAAGICVILSGGPTEASVTTGAGGAYVFRRLTAGTYSITTDAGEDCSNQNLLPGTRSGISVTSGMTSGGNDFALAPPPTPPTSPAPPIAAPQAAPAAAQPRGPAAPRVKWGVQKRGGAVTAQFTAASGATYAITATRTPGKPAKGTCTVKAGKVSCTIKLAPGAWVVSVTPRKGGVAGTPATKRVKAGTAKSSRV